MTKTTLPRITGAAPAGLLLAHDASTGSSTGSSWGRTATAPHTTAPHAPAPHRARPEPTTVDEAVWTALERMLAERERCRRAHPAGRGGHGRSGG